MGVGTSKDGKPGKDGVGIKGASQDAAGKLLIELTDGTKKGPFDFKGKGIKTVSYVAAKGELSLIMSDDTVQGPYDIRGPQGPKGDKGDKGEMIREINIVEGILTITTTDGKTFTGNAGGPKGDKGIGIKTISFNNGLMTITTDDNKTWSSSSNFISDTLKTSTMWCADGTCTVAGVEKKDSNIVFGEKQKNKWIMHAPDRPETTLAFAPTNAAGNGWDWERGVAIQNGGEVRANGKIFSAGRDILAELDVLNKKTAAFNDKGHVADRLRIGAWSIGDAHWFGDDGKRNLFIEKTDGNNQNSKMIIEASGVVTIPDGIKLHNHKKWVAWGTSYT
jgi:hypothetical protein